MNKNSLFLIFSSLVFSSLVFAGECRPHFTSHQGTSYDPSLEELLQMEKGNSFTFLTQNGFFSTLRKYVEAGKFEEGLHFFQTWPWEVEPAEKFYQWAQVPVEQKADCEYWMWKLFAHFIPKVTSRCIENPVTRSCDEGQYLEAIAFSFETAYPQNPRLTEIKEISEKFYAYKIQHEVDKLNLFIEEYEVAVRPTSLLSQFIENGLRGNNRRTDGKVMAHCVGPRPGLSGDISAGLEGVCEVVPRHALVTRILNQAQFIATFAHKADRAKVQAVTEKYTSELREMLKKNPTLRNDVYPTYREL